MHIKYIIKLEDDINELVVKVKLKINKCYAWRSKFNYKQVFFL